MFLCTNISANAVSIVIMRLYLEPPPLGNLGAISEELENIKYRPTTSLLERKLRLYFMVYCAVSPRANLVLVTR